MHSLEEQEQYEKVIDAFDRARELRSKVQEELRDQEKDEECR